MANRVLRDWTKSEKINTLSVQAERFYTRLIMKVDDFGCFYADTRFLKADLFPLLLDSIREADLSRWVAECKTAELIVIYEAEGKKYLQIQDFRQRLDRMCSKYPKPQPNDLVVNQPHTNDNQPPPETRNRNKKQKQETGNHASLVLPFLSLEFKEKWDLLLKEKKWKNKSIGALEEALKILSRAPNEKDALEMISKTIAGEWQGIFELDKNKKNGKSNTTGGNQNKPNHATAIITTNSNYGGDL